jgi:hypothetical protein
MLNIGHISPATREAIDPTPNNKRCEDPYLNNLANIYLEFNYFY